MLSLAVLIKAAGEISEVAVLSSSIMLVANFDKLLSMTAEAGGPVFLGLGAFFFGAFLGFGADVLVRVGALRGGGAGAFLAAGAGAEGVATRLFFALASASFSFERASSAMVFKMCSN